MKVCGIKQTYDLNTLILFCSHNAFLHFILPLKSSYFKESLKNYYVID